MPGDIDLCGSAGLSDQGELRGHRLRRDLQAVVIEGMAPHRRIARAVLREQFHTHRGLMPLAEIPFLDLGAVLAAGQRVISHADDARAAQAFNEASIFAL